VTRGRIYAPTLAHLRESVDALLLRKCDGDELASGPRIPEINEFLDGEIERLRTIAAGAPSTPPDIELFDGHCWPRAGANPNLAPARPRHVQNKTAHGVKCLVSPRHPRTGRSARPSPAVLLEPPALEWRGQPFGFTFVRSHFLHIRDSAKG
jgi:hypothetical protein